MVELLTDFKFDSKSNSSNNAAICEFHLLSELYLKKIILSVFLCFFFLFSIRVTFYNIKHFLFFFFIPFIFLL